MVHVLKEAVFVTALVAVGYTAWVVVDAIRPPATHSAGKANPFIVDNPRYLRMMGPTPEQVQLIMEGKSDAVESSQ